MYHCTTCPKAKDWPFKEPYHHHHASKNGKKGALGTQKDMVKCQRGCSKCVRHFKKRKRDLKAESKTKTDARQDKVPCDTCKMPKG